MTSEAQPCETNLRMRPEAAGRVEGTNVLRARTGRRRTRISVIRDGGVTGNRCIFRFRSRNRDPSWLKLCGIWNPLGQRSDELDNMETILVLTSTHSMGKPYRGEIASDVPPGNRETNVYVDGIELDKRKVYECVGEGQVGVERAKATAVAGSKLEWTVCLLRGSATLGSLGNHKSRGNDGPSVTRTIADSCQYYTGAFAAW